MLKEIKIKTREITKTDGSGTFPSYKAVMKDGKLIKCKFVRTVPFDKLPSNNDTIIVDTNNINIDRTHEYPTLWVKEVNELKSFERQQDEEWEDLFDNVEI